VLLETKGKTMSVKLTDTQLLMLSAAAQRADRCIAAPPSLGAAAQKMAAKLVAKGLAEEIKAKPGAHVWRRDDATGEAYALKLTAAGLKAIAVEEAEAVEAAAEISPTPADEGPSKTNGGTGSVAPPTAIAVPREGSKLAAVVDLLRREGGATIDQLADAMGWLPHTTRAALTGLRKRGFGIDRRKAKDERAGAYVIADRPNAAEG
jgi:Protein of unknown function (DUF3489)